MSYSFIAKGANKAALKANVAQKLDEVVKNQPSHSADQVQAQAAVNAFIDILTYDDTRDVTVSVSGSLWTSDRGLESASVSIVASFTARTS